MVDKYFIPKLFLQAISTSILILLLVFSVLRLLPGSPEDHLAGENATKFQKEVIREKLGLNHSGWVQLRNYMTNLAKADFGESLTRKASVLELIKMRLPSTFFLALTSCAFASFFGIFLGTFIHHFPNLFVSKAISFLSVLFLALPTFWLGPILVYIFSLHWPWLPISGFDSFSSIILPALTLGIGMCSVLIQSTSASLSDLHSKEFAQSARAKGCSEFRILFVHLFPNAFVPILMIIAFQFSHLLAGTIITEAVFDWPGIGSLAYDSITSRDYPTVQGIVIFISISTLFINLISDAIRIKFSPKEQIE